MQSKPEGVRLAKLGDEERLFALICASDEEWSMGRQDNDKVLGSIEFALGAAPWPKPVFGVVDNGTTFEGGVGMFPTEAWNSHDIYLRVFFHFVRPAYRRSRNAVHLAEFAKWFGDKTGTPVLFELLHPERTEAKQRMYARQAVPVGGLYLHGATAVMKEEAA